MRSIPLSPEEKAWLKAHPVIRLGVDPDYAPYSFRDANGVYQGLALDYLELIARQIGLQTEIVPELKWPQVLEGVRSGALDLIVTAIKTGAQPQALNFSHVYIPTPLVIMTREDDQRIDGPEDIVGHNVALVKGHAASDRVRAEYPSVRPHWVETAADGLTAVSVGEADVYVGVLGVNDFLSRQYGISNLKVAARYDMRFGGQRFGVRRDWPILVGILNKALDAIPEKKKIAIENRWISVKSSLQGTAALQQQNVLTEAETQWIRNHPVINLGVDPEFAPL